MRWINARLDERNQLVTIITKSNKIIEIKQQSQMEHPGDALSLGALASPVVSDEITLDVGGDFLLPGMIDAHVHSRDPGFPRKETWQTLAAGAYKGGVIGVCDMPNTKPPTMDRVEILDKAARAEACGLDFRLFLGVGGANIDRLRPLMEDVSLPLAGLKVYYGQSTGELMYADLMRLGQSLPYPCSRALVFHSEDQCAIDDNMGRHSCEECGTPGSFRVHSAIRSSAAAHASTRVILEWAQQQHRPVHIAHLSTPVEVDLIEEARARGVMVTSEVAPHHLMFDTDDYDRLGGYLKMNPPVRSPDEVRHLNQMFGDGRIEVYATDHAPHTRAEKETTNYAQCPSGVPGVEFFVPTLLTLADRNGLPMSRAIAMGAETPARLFGFGPNVGRLAPGCEANLVWVRRRDWIVPATEVASACGWTPYAGMTLRYDVLATWHRGRLVFRQTGASVQTAHRVPLP